ncbi:MAG: NADH-quinone oxidoreductase subunit NuoN [Gammaproteobacteria bacterium]|nr:NADH-quinone oxidoreductase subunit NuoN [Gammaproteobacteria bacterium]
MQIETIIVDYIIAVPEIVLLLGACVVLLAGAFISAKSHWTYVLTQMVLLATLYLCIQPFTGQAVELFNGFYISDDLSVLAKSSMCVFMIIVMIYSRAFINSYNFPRGEYYALTLFSLLGMMLISSANHLLMIYLGLELLSLSMYALVAMNRDDSVSSEAAIKYFVLGAIASGFLLYGISLIYGLTGTLYLSELTVENDMSIGIIAAVIFVVIGLAFKLGAVPFHMWLPDVYQGAPLSVTLLIASVPKIAGLLLALRLLMDGLQFMHEYWQQSLVVLAVLSLVAGNIIAIAQTNLRRMLGYSTIGHVGYILLGLLIANKIGYSAALFYTLIYALMSSAVFGILLCAERMNYRLEELDDLKGLSKNYPWLAFLMLLLMFSMAGIPMTVGFYAKLNVLQALVANGSVMLAIIAVVSSVIGAFYYLRVIKLMYFEEGNIAQRTMMPAGHISVLSIHSLMVVGLFVFPQILIDLCKHAIG